MSHNSIKLMLKYRRQSQTGVRNIAWMVTMVAHYFCFFFFFSQQKALGFVVTPTTPISFHFTTVNKISSFGRRTSFNTNNVLYSTTSSSSLEDMTVKQLWQMLEDADLVKPGLKSKLKRKQDVIDYIAENQNRLTTLDDTAVAVSATTTTTTTTASEITGVVIEEGDEDETNDDKFPVNDSSFLTGIDSGIVERIPPALAGKMSDKGINSLLPIQAKSFKRIYNGKDIVLQAPTGSGT